MLTTAWVDGEKVSIEDYKKVAGKVALCPLGHALIAKKGKKVIHHFAHEQNSKCDPFRQGLTNFHAQWQRIPLDKKNIEVCLDANGNITGNSSFRGYSSFNQTAPQGNSNNVMTTNVMTTNNPSVDPLQALFSGIPSATSINITTESHIADIIKPNPNGRPLVIEIQHSSIDKASIDSREKYYQHMVWVFNFTPRVVPAGKHNKVVFVDGKVSYLKEKVTYVAMISSLDMRYAHNLNATNQSPSINKGDQCLGTEPSQIYGIFIIINTRTKYWFETTTPTYFDCGYGILRLIMKLDKGFALTLYMSYEEFCQERMPEINKEIYSSCGWFHSQNPINLTKLNLMPSIINVTSIFSCKDQLIVYHNGPEFQGMGMERGKDNWHWFTSYAQTEGSKNKSKAKLNSQTTNHGQYPAVNTTAVYVSPTNTSNNNGGVIIQNQDLLMAMMTVQSTPISNNNNTPITMAVMPTTNNYQPSAEPQLANIALVNKVRAFLGVSVNVLVDIENMKGAPHILVYCNKETYNMKDKFKTLGMTYYKVVNADKKVKAKMQQSIDHSMQTNQMQKFQPSGLQSSGFQSNTVSINSYKTDQLANAVMSTSPSKGSFYHAPLKGFEDKLNKLV